MELRSIPQPRKMRLCGVCMIFSFNVAKVSKCGEEEMLFCERAFLYVKGRDGKYSEKCSFGVVKNAEKCSFRW